MNSTFKSVSKLLPVLVLATAMMFTSTGVAQSVNIAVGSGKDHLKCK